MERRRLFKDDRDRKHFLELLSAAVTRFGIVLHAFVLLDNHYHLVVETPTANLSAALQWVNVSYSVWFNRRRGRVGPLFLGRFKAVVVEPGAYAVELSRYVHLNPVRVRRLGLDKATQTRQQAGVGTPPPTRELVRERVRQLRAYRWSSYRAYGGWAREPAWLMTTRVLELFGGGRDKPTRGKYREFLEAAVREGGRASPCERLEAGLLLGGQEFVGRLRQLAQGDAEQQPAVRALRRRCDWVAVVRYVEELKGERWAEFRDRHGDDGRDLALWLGRMVGGLKLRERAQAVGVANAASVAVAVKRLEARRAVDADLREQLKSAQAHLSTKTCPRKRAANATRR